MSDLIRRPRRNQVSANVAIYNPAPEGIRWNHETDPNSPLYFHLNNEVWFGVGNDLFDSDLNEEAAAMRRLAEIASEVAAELGRRASVRSGARDTALTASLTENATEAS